jgi:acetoin utilization protein AcuB
MDTPSVSHYMTAQPWTIDRKSTVREAHDLMKEHGIRHLPVVDDGELVGVVSERDLQMIESLADVLIAVPVERVMRVRPFVVTSDAPLDEVAGIMATGKYGSAIILGRDGIEGIFTTVDACRALSDVLIRSADETLRSEHDGNFASPG